MLDVREGRLVLLPLSSVVGRDSSRSFAPMPRSPSSTAAKQLLPRPLRAWQTQSVLL